MTDRSKKFAFTYIKVHNLRNLNFQSSFDVIINITLINFFLLFCKKTPKVSNTELSFRFKNI